MKVKHNSPTKVNDHSFRVFPSKQCHQTLLDGATSRQSRGRGCTRWSTVEKSPDTAELARCSSAICRPSSSAASWLAVTAATRGPLAPTHGNPAGRIGRRQLIGSKVSTVMSLVNTAIGRVFAVHMPDDVLQCLVPQEALRLGRAAKSTISREYEVRPNRRRER